MTFDALYETENDADAGHRVVEGVSLRDAIENLNAILTTEGTHGRYSIDSVTETAASFAARRAHT